MSRAALPHRLEVERLGVLGFTGALAHVFDYANKFRKFLSRPATIRV
jgi:hypothetical protein